MRRFLHVALPLLAAAIACGGGSGAPTGSEPPLSLGENEPAPPSYENPGSGRENPGGTSSSSGGQEQGPSSSGGTKGCPCAGTYTCSGVSADGGAVLLAIATNGDSCTWTSGGQSVALACNGSTTIQGYQYTSSWSGSSIQLCAVAQGQQGQGPTCVSCLQGG